MIIKSTTTILFPCNNFVRRNNVHTNFALDMNLTGLSLFANLSRMMSKSLKKNTAFTYCRSL